MTAPARAKPGDWVEIGTTILAAGERAPQVPADTQSVPLEMRVKGTAAHAGRCGEPMTVTTAAGRTLCGILLDARPAYTHGFGEPVPELRDVGRELRDLIAEDGERDD